jgi:hypothetical protein
MVYLHIGEWFHSQSAIFFGKMSLKITKSQETQVMKPFYGILFCISCFLSGSLNAYAQLDGAGIVKAVSGNVFITSAQTTVIAVPNMKIIQGDFIRTGANGSAGLIFEDDTVVALGPNSEMSIENFSFNPVNKELSFIARMVHGTFSFITGQIAKLAPKKVIFETPDATLGVRGTKFLVKID